MNLPRDCIGCFQDEREAKTGEGREILGLARCGSQGFDIYLSTSSGIATVAGDQDQILRGYKVRQCCGQALMVVSDGMQLNSCELRRRLMQIDSATCVEDTLAVQNLIGELLPPFVNPSPGSVELADQRKLLQQMHIPVD